MDGEKKVSPCHRCPRCQSQKFKKHMSPVFVSGCFIESGYNLVCLKGKFQISHCYSETGSSLLT